MRKLMMAAVLLMAVFAPSTLRAEEPASTIHTMSHQTGHHATIIVAGVVGINGNFTGGGLVGLCYEQERQKLVFEVCSAISLDHHLTLTGEVSAAVFRRWRRVSLGGGMVVMSELSHEGHFVGFVPTVNMVVPLHHVLDLAFEVGGGPQWLVGAGSGEHFEPHAIGTVRGVAFAMVGLVIKLNP